MLVLMLQALCKLRKYLMVPNFRWIHNRIFFSLHSTNSSAQWGPLPHRPAAPSSTRVLASALSCPLAIFLKPALQPLGYPAKVWPSAGLYQSCALSLFYILYKPLLSYQLSVSDCTWAWRRSEWFWHICDIILFFFLHVSYSMSQCLFHLLRSVMSHKKEKKALFAWNDWWILLALVNVTRTNGFNWKALWLDWFSKNKIK